MQLGFSKDSFDEAEDGIKAWKLLSENQYGVILTDWNMPNMNGLELIQKIRAGGAPNQPNAPNITGFSPTTVNGGATKLRPIS